MKSNILKLRDEPTDIIIPTYNNDAQLAQCVNSIVYTHPVQPVRVIIVNNGDQPMGLHHEDVRRKVKYHESQHIATSEIVTIVNSGKNLGWEGGLKEGLKHSTSKYVVFANDDIFIPRSEMCWLRRLMREMENYPEFGMIGPSSNVVMGPQNIWAEPNLEGFDVPFLIGFCVMVRREALDAVGGIDDTLPGGDDIDLSIRMRKAGWLVICKKDVFVYHHGFQTGAKLYGTPDKPNGWNSREMTERTNDALIRKHGFLEWWQTLVRPDESRQIKSGDMPKMLADVETNIARSMAINGKVAELGCGAQKTIEGSIGVDLEPGDGYRSIADVVADVEKPMPFKDEEFDCIVARHIFEHCLNPIETLRNWKRYLKVGGRLVIAVPDQRSGDWQIAHPDHLHTYVPKVLDDMVECIGGFEKVGTKEFYNSVSFTSAWDRVQ